MSPEVVEEIQLRSVTLRPGRRRASQLDRPIIAHTHTNAPSGGFAQFGAESRTSKSFKKYLPEVLEQPWRRQGLLGPGRSSKSGSLCPNAPLYKSCRAWPTPPESSLWRREACKRPATYPFRHQAANKGVQLHGAVVPGQHSRRRRCPRN